MAVPTPFMKLHRKKYGDGIYLKYHLEDNALVNHHLSAFKDKLTEWLAPWEISMVQCSFQVPSFSLSLCAIPLATLWTNDWECYWRYCKTAIKYDKQKITWVVTSPSRNRPYASLNVDAKELAYFQLSYDQKS